MAFKCLECGHIFEDGEEALWAESRGECFGLMSYEKMTGCPLCRGSYEETVACSICGSEHLQDELDGGVCEECFEQYRKDFEICLKVSDGEKTEIKINALLASLFDVSDIEQILKEYILERYSDVDCGNFIDEDRYWFGERLTEEVKNNENRKK